MQKKTICYTQGQLDSLCGIYCIVNIKNYLTSSTNNQNQLLFNELVDYINQVKQKGMRHTIQHGLKLKHMEILCEQFLVPANINWSTPFKGKINPSLEVFWDFMQNFLAADQKRCILLRTRGNQNHWTVVTAVSQSILHLQDSKGLKQFRISHCETNTSHVTYPHLLWPAQSFFIKRFI